MPQYFFHFRGAINASDLTGETLGDDSSAHQYARQVAWELARNAPPEQNREAAVVVTDESGRVLLTVPLEGSVDPSS